MWYVIGPCDGVYSATV